MRSEARQNLGARSTGPLDLLNREQAMITMRRAYYLGSYHMFSHPAFDDYALPPLQAMIELTYRCNIRCQMCPFLPIIEDGSVVESQAQEITEQEIMSVVRMLPRYSLVTLTGGEPLVRQDFASILTAVARRNKVSIVTNGHLLNEHMARELVGARSRAFMDRGFFLLFCSIHGPPEIHDEICQQEGAFHRATDGIRNIVREKRRHKSAYPLISFNSVITRWNYHALVDIFRVAEELGVDFCNFSLRTYSVFPNRTADHRVDFEQARQKTFKPSRVDDGHAFDAAIMSQQLEELEDRAARSRVKLSYLPRGSTAQDILNYYTVEEKKGMVDFSCYSPWWRFLLTAYGDVSSCPNFSVGNIREDDIRTIWNNKHNRRFRRMLRQGQPGFCSKCDMSEK